MIKSDQTYHLKHCFVTCRDRLSCGFHGRLFACTAPRLSSCDLPQALFVTRDREVLVAGFGGAIGSDGSEWNAGYSSAGSAGDGDSVAPMILDPGDDIFGLLE